MRTGTRIAAVLCTAAALALPGSTASAASGAYSGIAGDSDRDRAVYSATEYAYSSAAAAGWARSECTVGHTSVTEGTVFWATVYVNCYRID